MKEFKILLVEDEKQMSMLIEMELLHEEYKVNTAFDGLDALRKFKSNKFDLILLDIMLPGIDGIHVCEEIRKSSQVPIIMLTAKGEIEERVKGLDVGANDYLPKPFAIEELLARIRVHERAKNLKYASDRIMVNELIMDKKTRQVFRKNMEIELTKKEYDILQMLMLNKNIVLTREQLLEKIWGYDYDGDTNVVDVFIRYLRSKIDDGFENKMIATVRGVGYVIKSK